LRLGLDRRDQRHFVRGLAREAGEGSRDGESREGQERHEDGEAE
jgi:hypothetical protein